VQCLRGHGNSHASRYADSATAAAATAQQQQHYTNRPRPSLRNALAGVIDGQQIKTMMLACG